MTTRARIESLFRPLGWALVALSAVFLVVVAREHWDAIGAIRLSGGAWAMVAMLALVYGLSLLLLAIGWHFVLSHARAEPVSLAHSVRAYGMAQLAKYVPGNVFHLVGRHMIHRNAGMADKALARAALAEIVLMIGAALAVVALCIAIAPPAMLGGYGLVAALLAGLLALGALIVVLRIGGGAPVHAVLAFALAFAFFTVMALMIAMLVALLGAPLSFAAAGGGVAAWLAGFVTPGAPGGLGIREAAMVLFAGGTASAEVLFVAAALFRLVSFGGDLVCFTVASLLPGKMRQTA
ncbi:MAG: hypothetical protein R3D89_09860 [Sphingomonadaceae bacterium]